MLSVFSFILCFHFCSRRGIDFGLSYKLLSFSFYKFVQGNDPSCLREFLLPVLLKNSPLGNTGLQVDLDWSLHKLDENGEMPCLISYLYCMLYWKRFPFRFLIEIGALVGTFFRCCLQRNHQIESGESVQRVAGKIELHRVWMLQICLIGLTTFLIHEHTAA